jgi:predicted nucleotide-binding protein
MTAAARRPMSDADDQLVARLEVFRALLRAYSHALDPSDSYIPPLDPDDPTAGLDAAGLAERLQEEWGDLRGDLKPLGVTQYMSYGDQSVPMVDAAISPPNSDQLSFTRAAQPHAMQMIANAVGAARRRARQTQLEGQAAAVPDDRRESSPTTPNVFIVHGHDDANALRLERLMRERWKLQPLVLRDLPMRGRSIIEKFEQEAEPASYAMILLTPDDLVRIEAAEYRQSRPNVFFELGWFCGRRGRAHVCLVTRGDVMIPSDLQGIGRVSFSTSVEEAVVGLEQELRAAGLIA